MPVRKNRPDYEVELKEWIAPIVAELNETPGTAGTDVPDIVEDYQAFSEKFSVRVIWTRWDRVPPEDRVPIILEAYKQSKRATDLPNITHARGLTPSEWDREAVADSILDADATLGNWLRHSIRRVPS